MSVKSDVGIFFANQILRSHWANIEITDSTTLILDNNWIDLVKICPGVTSGKVHGLTESD